MLAAVVVACSTGTTSPTANPTAAPTGNPIETPATPPASAPATQTPTEPAGFYLRAWYTQALPPASTFTVLPPLTISGGTVIDGNVAIPMIYPGPLLIMPVSRSITEAGTQAIVDEARRLGLLGETTDFTGGGVMPGGRVGNLQIVADGVTYDLIGDPDNVPPCQGSGCNVDAGTPQAFSAFWQELMQLDPWLGEELGASQEYTPERVAALFVAPADGGDLQQQLIAWPLDETFDSVGVEFPGQAGARCRTYGGDDLATLLPTLVHANQLTVFNDAVDNQASLMAVVVVPGAESPCPDEAE